MSALIVSNAHQFDKQANLIKDGKTHVHHSKYIQFYIKTRKSNKHFVSIYLYKTFLLKDNSAKFKKAQLNQYLSKNVNKFNVTNKNGKILSCVKFESTRTSVCWVNDDIFLL